MAGVRTGGALKVASLAGATAMICVLLFAPPAAAATWAPTGPVTTSRVHHTATLLPNGNVLVTGGENINGSTVASAEIYNPITNTWSPAATMSTPRTEHTATLLPNGRVLVTGGFDGSFGILKKTEIYNPSTDTWSPAASMPTTLAYHVATLLDGGKVLVAGGTTGTFTDARPFLYNPVTNSWGAAGTMGISPFAPEIVKLSDGRPLVIGGFDGPSVALNRTEIYNPATNSWSSGAPMGVARSSHTATLLPNGDVFVTGGRDDARDGLSSTEIYDPTTNTWTPAAEMPEARESHTASLLSNGKVLVAGGFDSTSSNELRSSVFYDPSADSWAPAPAMPEERYGHTATTLSDGKVLVAGGFSFGPIPAVFDPATTLQDTLSVRLDRWRGQSHGGASGGGLRVSRSMGDRASFPFTGTAVTWVTRKGNDQGKALVSIDGVDVATVDLYASSTQDLVQLTFPGLTDAPHWIVVRVLGEKNAASSDFEVAIDAFKVGSETAQETSTKIQYNAWVGTTNPSASGGTHRSSTSTWAFARATFRGSAVDWVTAKGPAFGMAQVYIDGVRQGVVDLYRPGSVVWQVKESYTGLGEGSHTIMIDVLGAKNPASAGTKVVVDAVAVP